MRKNKEHEGFYKSIKCMVLWSDTNLLEICLGLTLLAKSSYGAAFRGYPILMLLSGSLIGLYVIIGAVYQNLEHRHRAVSLMAVYYAAHIYASAIAIGLPMSRVVYLILTLLSPPLYLKWRVYREKLHREKL